MQDFGELGLFSAFLKGVSFSSSQRALVRICSKPGESYPSIARSSNVSRSLTIHMIT